MVREFYGPIAVTAPTPDPSDGTAIGYVSTALFVYRTRTGGAAETDLSLSSAGASVTTVTPDPATGAVQFWGPNDGYAGTLWIADPSGLRWPVFPSGLADRVAGTAAANTRMMPVWDGVGAHPTRPAGLPDDFYVLWRQPFAPTVGANYARLGDEWKVV